MVALREIWGMERRGPNQKERRELAPFLRPSEMALVPPGGEKVAMKTVGLNGWLEEARRMGGDGTSKDNAAVVAGFLAVANRDSPQAQCLTDLGEAVQEAAKRGCLTSEQVLGLVAPLASLGEEEAKTLLAAANRVAAGARRRKQEGAWRAVGAGLAVGVGGWTLLTGAGGGFTPSESSSLAAQPAATLLPAPSLTIVPPPPETPPWVVASTPTETPGRAAEKGVNGLVRMLKEEERDKLPPYFVSPRHLQETERIAAVYDLALRSGYEWEKEPPSRLSPGEKFSLSYTTLHLEGIEFGSRAIRSIVVALHYGEEDDGSALLWWIGTHGLVGSLRVDWGAGVIGYDRGDIIGSLTPATAAEIEKDGRLGRFDPGAEAAVVIYLGDAFTLIEFQKGKLPRVVPANQRLYDGVEKTP